MSRRNTDRNLRKRNKLAKSLRNTPPGYVDLIHYVKMRTRCTTGMAKKVLMSGALKVESHPVGYRLEGDRKILSPFLPVEQYGKLEVVPVKLDG